MTTGLAASLPVKPAMEDSGMDVLDTATVDELLDELSQRCTAIAVAVTHAVGDGEVTFRLTGDLMVRSGLVDLLASAQQVSIHEWLRS